MLDVPPSRYKIVEKDGRLIVFDNGVPVASNSERLAPPAAMHTPPVAARQVAAPRQTTVDPKTPDGRLDWLADQTAALMAQRRDAQGQLVIRRAVKQALRSRTQEATLTSAQARIYGMSMLSFAPLLFGMLVTFFFDMGVIGIPLLLVGVPLFAYGTIRLILLFGKLQWRDVGR